MRQARQTETAAPAPLRTAVAPSRTAPAPLRTAVALLFSPVADTAGALAEQILSADDAGLLAGALTGLPEATRRAACHQAAVRAAGLLDVDLLGLVEAGWQDHRELAIAARRSLATPGRIVGVDVAPHRITAGQQPAVTIEVDGHELVTVRFGLATDFDVTALKARISSGRLVAFDAGRCDATVTLAIQGTDVLTRRAQLNLAGITSASLGLRLLPGHAYAMAREIEESAEQLTYRRAS